MRLLLTDGRWPRTRLVTVTVIVAGWLPIVVYALHVSDDPQEVTLDLVLLGLGLVAAGLASWSQLRAARDRVRTAEQRIHAMGAGAVLPWECDADGRITFVGHRAQEHFGYDEHELIGMHLSELVHPQELARLGTYLQQKTGWQDERWRCRLKDGSERWFAGSAVPTIADDGRFQGYAGSTHPLGGDAADEQRLSEIAERVYARLQTEDVLPVFQPILSVTTGRLIGAEALSRFPGSDLTPDRWFAQASDAGLGTELELMALRHALRAARALPEDIYLSVNVGPQSLVRPGVFEVLTSGAIDPRRLVVEITEHASIDEYADVLVAVQTLRAHGVRLAVDDAGAGYSSFRHILKLAPEIIKLDRSLVAGLHDDAGLRALAAAVVAFGRETGASITAEGIETPEELRCAQDLGIGAAQGYLFGKPTADWTTWKEWHERGAVFSVAAAARDRHKD
jgi:PAS domain S-box-containing protein